MAPTDQVLIVDDETDVKPLFEQMLEEGVTAARLALYFASSGQEALEFLKNHPGISVVITDIRMPGMSGLELLEQIQSDSPLTRVVIMSAYSDMPNIRRAMHLGAHDFLTKPLDLDDVKATVERAARDYRVKADQETAFLLQMRQAQMGELLSVIAHQWRQPLSTVALLAGLGRSQLLDRKMDALGAVEIFRQVEEQVTFMSDTLRFFRNIYSQKQEPEKFDVSGVVRRAVQLMGPALSGVKLETTDEAVEVESFPGDLLQVMLCFLENAVHHFEENKTQSPAIHVRVTDNPEEVRIEVQDNGGGIKGSAENLFHRGYSTKGSSGLGLYVARMLVEKRCRGHVTAENKNGGALFAVTLPHRVRGAA